MVYSRRSRQIILRAAITKVTFYVEWELWSLICNLHSVGEAARQAFGCSENERSYIWWPNISGQLEQLAKASIESQLNQSIPNKTPLHPWKWATVSWQRIHIDYKPLSWSTRRRQKLIMISGLALQMLRRARSICPQVFCEASFWHGLTKLWQK